jgi:peroxiredoxin
MALVMVLSLLCFNSCAAQKDSSQALAPEFSLQDLEQNTVSLSDFRGKNAVLLFFWTTWCPYCQKELESLNSQYADITKDGLKVFPVNAGEPADRVRTYAANHNLIMPMLLDKDTAVSGSYNVFGVPTHVLINSEGKIVFQDNIFPQEYKDMLKAAPADAAAAAATK